MIPYLFFYLFLIAFYFLLIFLIGHVQTILPIFFKEITYSGLLAKLMLVLSMVHISFRSQILCHPLVTT